MCMKIVVHAVSASTPLKGATVRLFHSISHMVRDLSAHACGALSKAFARGSKHREGHISRTQNSTLRVPHSAESTLLADMSLPIRAA